MNKEMALSKYLQIDTEEASNLYIASGETITDLRSKLEKRKRSK